MGLPPERERIGVRDPGPLMTKLLKRAHHPRRNAGISPLDDNGHCIMKLESWHSAEDKRRWKIVRTDNYTDVPGEIVTADETTGECCMQVGGETKTMSFGPAGIRLVGRRR